MSPRERRRRFWWLDVLYPIALALFLFGSLTYIVYEGQRQWRLALQGESKLIQTSLRLSRGRPVRHPEKVLVVSATPGDIAALGRSPLGSVPDTTAAAYARALLRLGSQGVPVAFVQWDLEAHPTDEVYYLPLIEAARRVRRTTRVYLVTQSERASLLPPALLEQVTVLSDGLCEDPDVVQTACAFVDDPDWVMQAIVRELVPDVQFKKRLPDWVSRDLTSLWPVYLLSLSDARDLQRKTFRELLTSPAGAAGGHADVAFLGTDQTYAISGHAATTVTRNVLTVYDPRRGSPEVTGTPLHVFWGMVGQMFVDDAMVRVPPFSALVALTTALCLFLVFLMWRFGAMAALGIFLLYMVSGPYLNAGSMAWLRWYFPLFDSYYFGFFTIIVTGLGQLSTSAYKRWRVEALRRIHSQVADLKGNFISLLSHNLNTPVAKMQGMLALLSSQAKAAPWSPRIAEAEALVAQLEFSIRAVLVASALEEGVVNEASRSTKALLDELLGSQTASLRRIGVQLLSPSAVADDPDELHLPLAFDVRAVSTTAGALASLFHAVGATTPVNLTYRLKFDDAGRPCLQIELTCRDRWLSEQALEILAGTTVPAVRSLGAVAFFDEMMAGLVALTASMYSGRVSLRPDGSGGTVILTLHPTAGSATETRGTGVAKFSSGG